MRRSRSCSLATSSIRSPLSLRRRGAFLGQRLTASACIHSSIQSYNGPRLSACANVLRFSHPQAAVDPAPRARVAFVRHGALVLRQRRRARARRRLLHSRIGFGLALARHLRLASMRAASAASPRRFTRQCVRSGVAAASTSFARRSAPLRAPARRRTCARAREGRVSWAVLYDRLHSLARRSASAVISSRGGKSPSWVFASIE